MKGIIAAIYKTKNIPMVEGKWRESVWAAAVLEEDSWTSGSYPPLLRTPVRGYCCFHEHCGRCSCLMCVKDQNAVFLAACLFSWLRWINKAGSPVPHDSVCVVLSTECTQACSSFPVAQFDRWVENNLICFVSLTLCCTCDTTCIKDRFNWHLHKYTWGHH